MEGSPLKRRFEDDVADGVGLPPAKRPLTVVKPEEDDYDAEDQDDFFDEFEKELMEAGEEGGGGTPRVTAGTPHSAAGTPRATATAGLMSPPPPRWPAVPATEAAHGGDQALTPRGCLETAAAGGVVVGEEEEAASVERTGTAATAVVEESETAQEEEIRQQQELAQRNRAILNKLNDEQLHRYEQYRRSTLQKDNMRKLVQHLTNKDPLFAVNDKSLIVICGVAKIYVGELIETARAIASATGHEGALEPFHIRSAYRKLDKMGKIPHRSGQRRLKL